MKLMKRRLSILLCFLLAFTTVFAATSTEASAASTTYSVYGRFSENDKLTAYVGAKNFYAGDYFFAYQNTSVSTKYLGYLSGLNGVTYKSSQPSVASISKSGIITTKKAGTTKITVTYKKISKYFNLSVMSEKKFYSNFDSALKKTYTAAEKNAQSLIKKVGSNSKVTLKNAYQLLNLVKVDTFSGYYMRYDSTNGNKITYYIYSPSSVHFNPIKDKFSNAFSEYNPFSTRSAKHFEIKSVSGTGKNINVTLKHTVTDYMIIGANYGFSWDSEVKKSRAYTFPIIVQNTSTNYKYYAIATVKSGSNKMTIKLQNHKLVKGNTYRLVAQTTASGYYLGSWLDDEIGNINSFKAK